MTDRANLARAFGKANYVLTEETTLHRRTRVTS